MKTLRNAFWLSLIMLSTVSLAQKQMGNENSRKEEIESMKIGFLTRRLDLSPEEAKTFWPVYNQYQNELETIRKSRRSELKDAKKDFAEMNDKETEKIVDNEIMFRQHELDIMKKYHSQFKQVLPIKKVAVLYRTEEDFKRELLKRIQEKREDRNGRINAPPPPDQQ